MRPVGADVFARIVGFITRIGDRPELGRFYVSSLVLFTRCGRVRLKPGDITLVQLLAGRPV